MEIPPEHLIKHYQSYLSLSAKLRDGVISRGTIQNYKAWVKYPGWVTGYQTK